MVFISLGMSAVVPVSHALLAYGFERSSKEMGLNYLLGSGGLCGHSDPQQSQTAAADLFRPVSPLPATSPAPSTTLCATPSASTLGSSTSLARATRSSTLRSSLPPTSTTGRSLPPPRGTTTSTWACAGATKSSSPDTGLADRLPSCRRFEPTESSRCDLCIARSHTVVRRATERREVSLGLEAGSKAGWSGKKIRKKRKGVCGQGCHAIEST
jgi:hypothetical protein